MAEKPLDEGKRTADGALILSPALPRLSSVFLAAQKALDLRFPPGHGSRAPEEKCLAFPVFKHNQTLVALAEIVTLMQHVASTAAPAAGNSVSATIGKSHEDTNARPESGVLFALERGQYDTPS